MQTDNLNHLQNIIAGTAAAVLATVASLLLTVAITYAGTTTEIFLEDMERVPENTLHITVKNNSLSEKNTPICVQSPEQHLGCIPDMALAPRSSEMFTIFLPDTIPLSQLRLSYRDVDGDWHEIIDPDEYTQTYAHPFIFSADAVLSDTVELATDTPVGGNAALVPASLEIE